MSSIVNKSHMQKLPKIAAIDFDGTLVDDCFPGIGLKNEAVFIYVGMLKAMGYKLILWSCRDGEALDAAVNFCKLNGLVFDAVNDNIEEVKMLFNNNTRKVYADIYLDDKMTFFDKKIFPKEVYPCL